MKQIRQFLRDGHIELSEVPMPTVGADEVLVRSHHSFVSMGTEKLKVAQAQMNLAEKAINRPDQTKIVLKALKEHGFMPTYRKVQERLKAPATLGYSAAGVVAGVGERVSGFQVGDRVACIGEDIATHCEYNSVPKNLVVKVPDGVSLDQASSSAVGAISMQGVRQARLELGETVAVIGLGLLGQFLVQLCRANGCRVLGVDPQEAKRDLALKSGAESACSTDFEETINYALGMSNGLGLDAVFVTTAVKDNSPIEMSAAIVRDRGRVVCLGNTHIELDWRTWFGKEIDFLFSRAMGAGMFDPDYLMRGKDYPAGHVRWTANRNMQAFLDLIDQKKMDLSQLITHRFPFDESRDVFVRIGKGELAEAVGIVFDYDTESEPADREIRPLREPDATKDVRLGIIGAGNYAKSMILPLLPAFDDLSLEGICTKKGVNASVLAERYKFRFPTTDSKELVNDSIINAVMVATRHDSHAHFAAQALDAGKHVYVEKPLALDSDQLANVLAALNKWEQDRPTIWVGHNRRYAPISMQAMKHFEDVPVRQVSINVRTAPVPADSWYQDPSEGGGMLFGDVCHFIDLAIWFSQSQPVEVHAFEATDAGHQDEGWTIQMRFANGGLATVFYTSSGAEGSRVENVEILGGGRSAELSDFRKIKMRGGKKKGGSTLQPDLGQKAMLQRMLEQFKGVRDETESFIVATQALLATHRSILERRVVKLDDNFPYRLFT